MKAKTILLLVFIVSLPSIFPLFHPGLFVSDDAEWMIIRFSAFHQALVDGQFPVRWLGRLNYEYGYPVVNFNYPAFLYFAEIPKVLGFGFVNSIKIVLGFSMVLSAMFAYLWLVRMFEKWPAFVGSFFYLYTPYHLFDLYKRGSVGEVLALAVAPFVLWQIERRSLFWTSIGIGALVLSHNILAVLFLSVVIIYMLFRRVSGIKYQVLSIVFGLMIPSFFWVPAIFDLPYTVFTQTTVSEWYKNFASLDIVGLPVLSVFLMTFFFLLSRKIAIAKHRVILLAFSIGVTTLLFATKPSLPLWGILPSSLIQFPFRFLSITILFSSFLVAAVTSALVDRTKAVVGTVFMLVALISSWPFITRVTFTDKGEGFYATNQASTTIHNEYMPKWVKALPTERPKEKVEIVSGKGTTADLQHNHHRTEFTVNMEGGGTIRFNTIYFPGWKALMDGQQVPISFDNAKGVMEITAAKGRHSIVFSFGETVLRLASNTISLVSLVVLTLLVLKKRYEFS